MTDLKETYFSVSERKLFLRVFDIVFAMLGLWIVSLFLDFNYFNFDKVEFYEYLVTLIVYFLIFGQIFELYNLKVANDKYVTFRSLLLTTFTTTFIYIFTPIIAPLLPESRIQILYLFFGIAIPVYIWRLVYMTVIYSPYFSKNILLIGNHLKLEELIALIKEKAPENRIVACISDLNEDKIADTNNTNVINKNLYEIVQENLVKEIIVSSFKNENVSKYVNQKLVGLFEKGIAIKSADNFIEEISGRVPLNELTHEFYNNYNFSKSHENKLYNAFWWLLDRLIAIVGILFFMLLVPFVIIFNTIWNKGPLFYKQKRVGKGGDEFVIYKLRTMVKNAEQDKAVWATKNDSRVTSFGKFLRRIRIDEMPQFYNILKGEMSLIGPRPERKEFVNQLLTQLPFYSVRHIIKPGLTGWAQVMYPYANTIEDQGIKLQYDLYYIKERSMLLDFKILVKTISTVLFFRGT